MIRVVDPIASLSRLEGKPLPRSAGVARPVLTPMQRRSGLARRQIAALGYNECVTYSFVDRDAARSVQALDSDSWLAVCVSGTAHPMS